mgnify:CR=1 FL=1
MRIVSKYRFYLAAIVIGALCAAYFIYAEQKGDTLAVSSSLETAGIFPQTELTAYDMSLYLDINDRTLYGTTVIDTINTSGQALEELWFTAYPNAFHDPTRTPAPADAYYSGFNEGWLKIDSFKVNGTPVEYQEEDISVRAILPAPLPSDKKLKIEMTWRSKIPKLAYRYGYQNGVYMLGNFYPALNVLQGQEWHNPYNSKFGDPFCFQVANYQVRVNLPETYDMVSTGDTVNIAAEDNGRTLYWVQADQVRDFCLLVMYDYQESSQEIKGRNIKCYAPSNNSCIVNKIAEQSGEILEYYSSAIGPYPYADFKIAFVPMKGFHGMEYSGLVFLREEFLHPGYDENKIQFILAHEIAHQWWYGMVGNDQFREPWLDEGLANWSAYKYLEKCRGQSTPDMTAYQSGVKLNRQLDEMRSAQDYYNTAYDGGGAFWFGLEQELGEETVIKVLRNYLAANKFKIATTEDLLAAIKKEVPRDMESYFDKWF